MEQNLVQETLAPSNSILPDESTCCPERKSHATESSRWLIIGGGGYVGWNIAQELGVEQNEQVCMTDIAISKPLFALNDAKKLPSNTVFLKADVKSKSSLFSAFEEFKPDVVLHICSYGMSGMEQLNKQLIEDINLEGVKNVLEACVAYKVERFVYLSSDTVVLGEHDIVEGDENTPRVPLYKHYSHYALTKAVAEEIVLASDGKVLNDSDKHLRTCVLRSGGIYGVGEMRHVPRVIRYLEQGMLFFVPGTGPATQDFINIRNLVQALILAGDALTRQRNCIAAGKVYCISDGCPIGAFDFFAPLISGLGYTVPKIRVPAAVMFALATLAECVVSILPASLAVAPFLTRQETLKSCTVHYFSIERARRELNFKPIGPPNDMKAVAEHYVKHGYKRAESSRSMQLMGKALPGLLFLVFIWFFYFCL